LKWGIYMVDGFSALERLLYIADKRHTVIASNLANVDTPNYKARDVRFEGALQDETIAMRATHPLHISQGDGSIVDGVAIETRQSWADGNDVELDMEVARMTENALLFQAGITALSTKMRMLRNAMRR
jgi:flagellar basal-body rod protein FlgB